jgi:hypothetical protein
MVRSKVSLADMALAWGEEERVGTGEGIDGGEGQANRKRIPGRSKYRVVSRVVKRGGMGNRK